jgi:cation transport ATPase
LFRFGGWQWVLVVLAAPVVIWSAWPFCHAALKNAGMVVSGRLVVWTVRVGSDIQLAHLVALVEQAQSRKAAIERLADRMCGVFVPAVLVAWA